MARITTDDIHYTEIADAIREKTGMQTKYRPEEMAAGVNEVFAAAIKREYDRFWDTFQQDGKRTDYKNGFFGPNWTDETFQPKYDLVCTDCNSMFCNVCINDIKGILEKRGIAFDTSACPNVNSMFYTTQFAKDKPTNLPAVDVSNVSNINAVFYGQSQVTAIELLNVQENAMFTRAFYGCTGLVDLTITGTIGGDGLDLSRSDALSKTSIENVINCLSANTSGKAITLSVTAVNKAFEASVGVADGSTSAEWAALANTKPNWTINLV